MKACRCQFPSNIIRRLCQAGQSAVVLYAMIFRISNFDFPMPAIFQFAHLHLAFFLSRYISVFASGMICIVVQSFSLFAVISALSDLVKSSTFGRPMISPYVFIHLFFVITFILSVNAQSTTLSTVTSPTTTTSESASASFSSQTVWSEKS